MTLANNTPHSAQAVPLRDAAGRPVVVAIVKATFAEDAAGRWSLAEDPSPSVLSVVRHMKQRGVGRGHADYHVIPLETFRLSVGQMAWFIWWDYSPLPNQAHITDEELDEKMVPEVEARRHVWDRPASDDDPDFWGSRPNEQGDLRS